MPVEYVFNVTSEEEILQAEQLIERNRIGKYRLNPVYTGDNILHKEVEEGLSWFRIRNQTPCTDCVYQWFCPLPSNYEIAIRRPNLCRMNKR
jgi:hypothetical protein